MGVGKTEELELARGSLVQAGKALPDLVASNDLGTEDGLIANRRVTMAPPSGIVARDDAGEVASRVSTRRTSAAEKFGHYPEHRELSINF